MSYKEALVRSRLSPGAPPAAPRTNLASDLDDVAPCPSCVWGPNPG